MMKEFSMHVMDIAQNSVAAGAKHIELEITEDGATGFMMFKITDDGRGMDAETVAAVRDPFKTSRTTRKVGLGIPMLEQTCIQCGGLLNIRSEPGKGTELYAKMLLEHIDRPPMGDIGDTIFLLVIMNSSIDFKYTHEKNGCKFVFDTSEIREVLGDIPFNEPEIAAWIKENIAEGLKSISAEGN